MHSSSGPTHRIWVTRDELPDGPLCLALRECGLEPICEPIITRRIVGNPDAQIAELGPRDWLVLTSIYAIEHIPIDGIRCRIAVVGESSREIAEDRGLRISLVSPDGTGAALWRMLGEHIAGAGRIFYPRSSLAEPPDEVGGLAVESPVLYETAPRRFDEARITDVAGAAIASPSAATIIAQRASPPSCASIGPTTSAALRAAGVEPWLESPRPTLSAFAAAIARSLAAARQKRDC